MKGKIQIVLLSMVTAILTSWITFTTLTLNAEADSAATAARPPSSITSETIAIKWGSPSDPTTKNFIQTPWTTNPLCDNYYSTDPGNPTCFISSNKGTTNYDNLLVGPEHYAGKNYLALCDQGQVMVGFQWGVFWGNRYVLVPICQSISLEWANTMS